MCLSVWARVDEKKDSHTKKMHTFENSEYYFEKKMDCTM